MSDAEIDDSAPPPPNPRSGSATPPLHQQQEEEDEHHQEPPQDQADQQQNQQNNDQEQNADGEDAYAVAIRIAAQLQQQQQNQKSHDDDDDDDNSDNHQQHQSTQQRQDPAAPVDAHVQLQAGDLICDGKFEALAKLGAGESATVWLARSTSGSQRVFAVKLFKADPMVQDSFDYERRINEFVLRAAQRQQQQREQQSPTNSSPALISPTQNRNNSSAGRKSTTTTAASLSKLPFAAQDAWFQVQLRHLPKAVVRPSREPSFFMVKGAPHINNNNNSPLGGKSKSGSHDAGNDSNKNNGTTPTTTMDSQQTTPRRSPRQHMMMMRQQQQHQQEQQHGQRQQSDSPTRSSTCTTVGVAALVGHARHHDPATGAPHPALVFEALGPSVEWMMSVFEYKGVALPVALAIVESACEALVTLETAHVVTCDLKPENLLFRERDFQRIEQAAKRSVGGGSIAGLSALFRVVTIDLGLSFLLPLAQRTTPPPPSVHNHHQSALHEHQHQHAPQRGTSSSLRSSASVISNTTTSKAPSPPSQQQNQQQNQQRRRSSTSRSISSSNAAASATNGNQNPSSAPLSPSNKRSSSNSICPSAEELLLLRMSNYRRGVQVQTREYRAPEIIFGAHFSRADVFSLGCTLWELVTGNFLFDPKRDVELQLQEEQASGVVLSATQESRLLDLRHLWEMRRVLGDPPQSYLLKFGEGGSGIHAHRFADSAGELRLECECLIVADRLRLQRRQEEQQEGEEEEPEDEDIVQLRKTHEKQRRRSGRDGLTRFCPRCSRISVPPPPPDTRDLFAESQSKFTATIGDEAATASGHRYFVDFVLSCCQWEPSKRPRAAELLRHPLFTIFRRKFE